MTNEEYKSEIRDSIIRELIEKTRKANYKQYLIGMRLERVRLFLGAQINFDFPVTALIGPNGGGKSTILGAAASAYYGSSPSNFFRKSRVGDESMDDWVIEYEVIDKDINPKGTVRTILTFKDDIWSRDRNIQRNTNIFGISRTIPSTENPFFALRRRLSTPPKSKKDESYPLSVKKVEPIDHIKREAERILGKSLLEFNLFEISSIRTKRKKVKEKIITGYRVLDDGREVPIIRSNTLSQEMKEVITKQLLYVGSNGQSSYSEFNFGAGEASIIRMVAEIESSPSNSLILIEEIENGLHPLAVRRTVEYLIDVVRRKNSQVIFTTHSDYALTPLPSEAIWAAIDGRLQQGKLSVEVLRAVSGRIDKRLAIFVEDDFAKAWIEAVIRERLSDNLEEIGIYPVYGDGNAVKTHLGHSSNPAIQFRSICMIDGDSRQIGDEGNLIFRLPGAMPESTIFNEVLSNLDDNIALLTIACQRPLDKQGVVAEAVRAVSSTNRDPHLLFSQVGMKLGFISEATIRGAFLTVWIQENSSAVTDIVKPIQYVLELPPKTSTSNKSFKPMTQ